MRRTAIIAAIGMLGCGEPSGTSTGTSTSTSSSSGTGGTGGTLPASLHVDWEILGPFGGRANTVAVSPHDPLHLLAAADTGGVFESYDGGASWAWASDGITTPLIAGVAFDPKDASVALALTNDGIFKRDGAGFRLVEAGLSASGIIRPIVASPQGDRLVAATTLGVGVSTDHGETWTLHDHPYTWLTRVAFDPVLPDVLYLMVTDAVLRSDDGGMTFTPLAPLPGASTGIGAAGASALYVNSGSTTNPHLYRSGDGGMTWQTLPAISGYDLVQSIVVDPTNDDEVYVGASFGLHHSADGGQTWEDLQKTHACPAELCGVDIVDVVPDWGRGLLYVAHDQGVYTYDIKTGEFTGRDQGLTNIQAYTLAAGWSGTLYLGTQDTGEPHLAGGAWLSDGFGDVGDLLEPKDTPGYWGRQALAGEGMWHRDQNGMITGFVSDTPYPLAYPRHGSMIEDPAGGGILVASDVGTYHLDLDGTGTQRSPAPTRKLVWNEEKAALYASRDTEIFVIEAGGSTTSVAHFDADIDDFVTRGDVIVAIAGGLVSVSRDAGKTWKSASMPAGARVVAANPRCPDQYLVGYAKDFDRVGSDGLYLTKDAGETWDAIGDPLKLYAVSAIAFLEQEADTAYVSTYGRGLFRGRGEIFAKCR